jgi:cell division protein FtsQ
MKIKKILISIVWIILLAAALTGLGFTNAIQKQAICTGIEIRIHRPGNQQLITETEIRQILHPEKKPLIGQKVAAINTRNLEEKLSGVPSLANAEVYITPSGMLNVKVKQREAIVKIFNNQHRGFYIDTEGNIFSTPPGRTARVPVASGRITHKPAINQNIFAMSDSISSVQTIRNIHLIAKHFYQNKILQALIPQIFINDKNEIELIPNLGNHTVLLGNISHLDDKLLNLLIFYRKAHQTPDFNVYKTINLKYRNQVICSKN